MFLVWVRIVFTETKSSTGDVGSVQVGCQQPQHIQFAFAQRLDEARPAGRLFAGAAAATAAPSSGTAGQEPTNVVPLGPLSGDGCQQGRHRRSLAERTPGRSLPVRPGSAPAPAAPAHRGCRRRPGRTSACSTRISMTLPVLPPASAAASSRCSKSGRLGQRALVAVGRVPRQEHPGQGDVLELPHVRQVVVHGQALLPGPAEGFAHLARARPAPEPASPGPAARSGRSRPCTPAAPRPAGSSAPARSPWASRTRAMATRQRYGFCASPSVLAELLAAQRRCRVAAFRSPRSQAIWLIPTYMSAVPRSTVGGSWAASCSACS